MMPGKGVTVWRQARCWCGHSGSRRLVILSERGILRAGPVCRYHASVATWPEAYLAQLWEVVRRRELLA